MSITETRLRQMATAACDGVTAEERQQLASEVLASRITILDLMAERDRLRAELAEHYKAKHTHCIDCSAVFGPDDRDEIRHHQRVTSGHRAYDDEQTITHMRAELAEAKAQLAARDSAPSGAEIEVWRDCAMREACYPPYRGCHVLTDADIDSAVAIMRRALPDDELARTAEDVHKWLASGKINLWTYTEGGTMYDDIDSFRVRLEAALSARKGAR
jgi:hypothetical protein